MARRLNAEAAEEARRNDLTDQEKTALFNAAVEAELNIRRKRQENNAVLTKDRNENVISVWKGKLGFPMGKLKEAVDARIVKDEAEEKDNDEKLMLELEFQRIKFLALEIGSQGKFDLGGGAVNMPPKKSAATTAANGNAKGDKKPKDKKADKAAKTPGQPNDDEESAGITDTVAEAGEKGEEVGLKGGNLTDNPYPIGSRHHQAWSAHYKLGQKKLAKGIKQTPDEQRPN